ncbi:hypothetical protein [Marinomonas algicola]|uniref:hypothetical protein n=1 Tax=Marinomonas algicola TaxID=2773454 RepID=UPI00174B8F05|nr:hypothetical protein [Marinomonas algicola]
MDKGVNTRSRFKSMQLRLTDLENYIESLDDEIDRASQESSECQAIRDILGVGRLTSSA